MQDYIVNELVYEILEHEYHTDYQYELDEFIDCIGNLVPLHELFD